MRGLVLSCVFILLSLVGYVLFSNIILVHKIENEEIHFEVVAQIDSVIDGDTVSVQILEVLAGVDPAAHISKNSIEHVRFGGGIDAPETWTDPPENGASEAKQFLENLLPPNTIVYLDLNDAQSGEQGPYRDHYGRLIAVIYIENDNHWINVNAELLRWGMEHIPGNNWLEYIGLPSEWDPLQWLEEEYPYVSGRW